ncbi:VOC family protein [Paenibacillus sp. alder61]|uniref:VOC family protein n=1 Tax=Paenibacillus faecis TaxID=862114 RepID=A0A5D0D1P0_9BACL|nr:MULTISPECIES: VOC family protein [Paenibacillus]MCA1294318.1 VOC family protein [Paenibacillus sp. alder61]TYA15077.1 VOC family protein [Paenibacillus faecis]
MSVKKIEHVGIRVTALEDSIEFYVRVIGLRHLHTVGEVGEALRLAFLTFPGQESVELELIYVRDGEELPREGRVHHIAFTVANIEEEYARISRLGLSGLDPEIRSLPNGSRFFFFNGPDGERIEFFEPSLH